MNPNVGGVSTDSLKDWLPASNFVSSFPGSKGGTLGVIGGTVPLSSLVNPVGTVDWEKSMLGYASGSSITTHKGVDVYEVVWSVDVVTNHELRRPSIDEIGHVGPSWEQIA